MSSKYIVVRRATGTKPNGATKTEIADVQSANAPEPKVEAVPVPRRPVPVAPLATTKKMPQGLVMLCIGLAIAIAVVAALQLASRETPALERESPSLSSYPTITATTTSPSDTPEPTASIGNLVVLTWDITAYTDAGDPIGPVSAGRPFSITAYLDETWAEAEAPDWQGAPASGSIRVRAVDLLRQPPTPTPVPPTATPLPYVPPPPTPVPPPPTVCVENEFGSVCGTEAYVNAELSRIESEASAQEITRSTELARTPPPVWAATPTRTP